MSEMSKQTYELAFHLNPALEEADVQRIRQELEKIITTNGGIISFSKDPEKIRLAYPIKHLLNSNFGYMNFNLELPELVNQIRDEVKLNHDVIRFLILRHEEESKKRKEDVVRRMAAAERRKARLKVEKAAGAKADAPKMDEKKIDEKLEEIIDKL
jgi:ribosomal protein S6